MEIFHFVMNVYKDIILVKASVINVKIVVKLVYPQQNAHNAKVDIIYIKMEDAKDCQAIVPK